MVSIKIAFVYSGQGAQYTGMGKELYNNFRICKDVFDEADSALSMHISKVCFDINEADKLGSTEYCQPAILTLSMACCKLLAEADIHAGIMAGLSLGEYSALTCSGAFGFPEAVGLVRKRGRFMAEAVPQGIGAMSAILGLEASKLEKACLDAEDNGYVICANYNAPGQIVISGEVKAVERAEQLALEYGAKRAVRIKADGPFHTAMLNPAAQRLEEELNKIKINNMKINVISNIDAKIIKSKDDIIPTLLKQIVSPVRWEQSIRNMIADGINTFVEIGPGKTLSALIKKINREVKIYNIEDLRTYENVLKNCRK